MTDTIKVYQLRLSMRDRENDSPLLDVWFSTTRGAKYWKPEYMQHYTHVTNVNVLGIVGNTKGKLEAAYATMQRIDEERTPEKSPNVTDLTGIHHYHSMSMGDIVEYKGVWYICDTVGFTKVKVVPPVVYSKENMSSLKLLINSRISTIKELLEKQPNLQIKNQLTFLKEDLDAWNNESIVRI